MKTVAIPVPEGRTPMVALCGASDCDHVWIALWLPMEMLMAAAVMKSLRCPLCGNPSPRLADSGHVAQLKVTDDNG